MKLIGGLIDIIGTLLLGAVIFVLAVITIPIYTICDAIQNKETLIESMFNNIGYFGDLFYTMWNLVNDRKD